MRRPEAKRSCRGFTLIELMIVVTIIGIIMAFILTASMGGIRSAEIRATQSLISKLEMGITDRLEALTYQQSVPTAINWPAPPGPPPSPFTHAGLAAVYGGGTWTQGNQRAQVIAQTDYLKAELPDVFMVQYGTAAGSNYPFNFAMQRFGSNGSDLDFLLPMGAGDPTLFPNVPSTGILGASYSVASGIYKQICTTTFGFDGIDNPPGNGLVDDLAEWGTDVTNSSSPLNLGFGPNGTHTHKTARAEMLYALLVEGQGPLGSPFNRDEFKNSEIRDTDGDGLMEFVDSWGEPIYFYRWPIMYRSDIQKGFAPSPGPYGSVFEARQQDSIDPNQQLMAPSWWGATNTGYVNGVTPLNGPPAAPGMSSPAIVFQNLFHALAEPLVVYQSATANSTNFWDRSPNATSGLFPRRAFYSKFLIISSGPDKQLGLPICGFNYAPLLNSADGSGAPVPFTVGNLMLESEAAQVDLNRPATLMTNQTTIYLQDSGTDDISNHNFMAPGGVVQ